MMLQNADVFPKFSQGEHTPYSLDLPLPPPRKPQNDAPNGKLIREALIFPSVTDKYL